MQSRGETVCVSKCMTSCKLEKKMDVIYTDDINEVIKKIRKKENLPLLYLDWVDNTDRWMIDIKIIFKLHLIIFKNLFVFQKIISQNN